MKKRAFTLAETLIVLCIIGVLAVILLTSMGGMQPDKEKTMFKKAYQITERAVGELVNDESIYPYSQELPGFYNLSEQLVEGTLDTYQGEEKFCQFFARKLNTYQPAVWDGALHACTFQTTDGVSWIVESNFEPPVAGGAAGKPSCMITVDVNGSLDDGGKGPDTDDDTQTYRDIFYIFVDFDGRVRVEGQREIQFLRSHDAKKHHN